MQPTTRGATEISGCHVVYVASINICGGNKLNQHLAHFFWQCLECNGCLFMFMQKYCTPALIINILMTVLDFVQI